MNIIKLETAHFHYIPFTGPLGYLPGKTVSYIPHHGYVVTGVFQNIIGKLCSSAFPVATRYRYNAALFFIPVSKFYLTAYFNSRADRKSTRLNSSHLGI